MVKTLFIYSGTDRRALEEEIKQGLSPDTSFFGFTYVRKDSRIDASYIQINKNSYTFAGGLVRKYAWLRIPYLFLKFRKEFLAADVIVLMSSAYFELMYLKRFKLLSRRRWIILNLDLSTAFQPIAKAADRIICISKAQTEDLLKRGFHPERTIFIPLGVDKNFYKPVNSSREFILTIGRDVGRDFKTFLEAVKLSEEKTVMICSPKNVEGLEDMIPANLTILFDLPYQELKKYYQKAKVFVIATKPGNHFGSDCPGQTVILDTLAYNIPVVATYMPWFEGYFENGRHLITVPAGDPEALRKAMKEVASDRKLREVLSREGRKLVEERCNSEAMGNEIAELILKEEEKNWK